MSLEAQALGRHGSVTLSQRELHNVLDAQRNDSLRSLENAMLSREQFLFFI